MKKGFFCLAIFLFFAVSAVAMQIPTNGTGNQTATLGFEDIGTSIYGHIPDGYGGLNWDNFGYMSANYISGYEIEGNYSAFNYGGNVAYVTRETISDPFTFQSAYFKGAWNPLDIAITAYSSEGYPVFEETIVVDVDSSSLFSPQLDWDNIVGLSFYPSLGAGVTDSRNRTHFGMDEFTFSSSSSNSNPVPEPATIILVGSGLAGFGFIQRRKAKKAREK
ncbi:MAG: PEP-CTERM sorting domain-containing protein [Patescibacteria group bacterium]|nr:PEP-CTERM sorting domain-containing protein [Patescibacteria group bacterium]